MQLTDRQLGIAIEEVLLTRGINAVMELFLNSLMKLEREEFLLTSNQETRTNKGNGYRFGSIFYKGSSFKLRIPRDRIGQFYPVILALLRNEEEEIDNWAFELYGKGLTTRDVSDIFQKIYGNSYSKSSISRINQNYKAELEAWRNRPLEQHYPVIVVDAIHTHIRRDSSVKTEAVYVVMGVREDKSRDILAIENIPTESSFGWKSLFTCLKSRGIKSINLIIADGLTGLEQVIAEVFPQAEFQKCVTHLKRNIVSRVRTKHKQEIADDLREVFVTNDPSYTKQMGMDRWDIFIKKWSKIYRYIANFKSRFEMVYYFTYLNYDSRVRSMIYTTNWIENLNKQFRKVLKIRNSMPSDESLLLLLSKVALDKTERYLNYPIYIFKFDKNLFPDS